MLKRRMCSGEPGASIAHARFRPGGGEATPHPSRTQFLADLERHGYPVTREATGEYWNFDLLAERGAERIA